MIVDELIKIIDSEFKRFNLERYIASRALIPSNKLFIYRIRFLINIDNLSEETRANITKAINNIKLQLSSFYYFYYEDGIVFLKEFNN